MRAWKSADAYITERGPWSRILAAFLRSRENLELGITLKTRIKFHIVEKTCYKCRRSWMETAGIMDGFPIMAGNRLFHQKKGLLRRNFKNVDPNEFCANRSVGLESKVERKKT